MHIMAASYIWLDGKMMPRERCKVDILTHSLQYGSGIFEGIREYNTDSGPRIFRLRDHVKRFFNSARICSMELNISEREMEDAIIETVKKNKLKECYIRPFAFYNDTSIGLSTAGKKVSIAIAAVPFGNYFKDKEKGISCIVSSWRRINSQILPPQAKSSGHYRNSITASAEAKSLGANEAVLLDTNGYVAEGPGENIFLVKNSALVTPSESSDILVGITRDSIIKLAEAFGIHVEERQVHREELYTCEELFFTGTAAEITTISKIDGRVVGKGVTGPVTRLLSSKFYEAAAGRLGAFTDWLTPVR
jgi:branched-chain amino acid aminotransferase